MDAATRRRPSSRPVDAGAGAAPRTVQLPTIVRPAELLELQGRTSAATAVLDYAEDCRDQPGHVHQMNRRPANDLRTDLARPPCRKAPTPKVHGLVQLRPRRPVRDSCKALD